MVIKEVIEGYVATRAGTVLRSLEAIGLPPEERLAYIYDWKALALDFGLVTLIGIGLGGAVIAFKGAAGEAVERAVKEGMGDTLEGAGDTAACVAKEGMEGVLEDTTERAAKEGLESGSTSNVFKAPEITINSKGELTNGTYTLNGVVTLIREVV